MTKNWKKRTVAYLLWYFLFDNKGKTMVTWKLKLGCIVLLATIFALSDTTTTSLKKFATVKQGTVNKACLVSNLYLCHLKKTSSLVRSNKLLQRPTCFYTRAWFYKSLRNRNIFIFRSIIIICVSLETFCCTVGMNTVVSHVFFLSPIIKLPETFFTTINSRFNWIVISKFFLRF